MAGEVETQKTQSNRINLKNNQTVISFFPWLIFFSVAYSFRPTLLSTSRSSSPTF
jgi:hypothetical protein